MEEEFILSQPSEAFKRLSKPLIIFAIFTAFYNLIDLYWANFISQDAIVVIAIVMPLFVLINTIGKNIGQGTNVVMSHFQGAFNLDETSNTLIHGILICIFLSILIPLLILSFFNPLINILSIQNYSSLIYNYIMPLSAFSFIFIFPLFFTETAISEGTATRPIIYLIVQDVMKFTLAPILIFKIGLGIAGLAYATLISSFIPFILFLYLYKSKTKIKIDFSKFKLNLKTIYEIFLIAIPNAIDTGIFAIFTILMNLILIELIGSVAIVLYTIFTNLVEIIASPARGGARGLLTIIGHLKGNKDFDKIKTLINYVFKFEYKLNIISILIYTLISTIIIVIFNKDFIRLFTDLTNYNILKLNLNLILICILLPISYICSHILNGLKKSFYSLLNSIIAITLMIVLSFILSKYTALGIWGVFIGILMAEIIVSITYILTTHIILFKLKITDIYIFKIKKK